MSMALVMLLLKYGAVLLPAALAFWKVAQAHNAAERKKAAEAALLKLLEVVPDLWNTVQQEKRKASIADPLGRALQLANDVSGGLLARDSEAKNLVELKLRSYHEQQIVNAKHALGMLKSVS